MGVVATGLKRRISNNFKVFAWKMGFNIVNPPHEIKQWTIVKYKQETGCKVLVETGTYLGDMVFAQLKNFDRIFSIELSKDLFERAKKRFSNESNVKLLHGDSGICMNEIMLMLTEKALFWLDGHYSGGITAQAEKDCPVMEELQSILKSPQEHVILIDDARLFTSGAKDYPSLNEIEDLFKRHNKRYSLKIENDIIVIQYVS